MDITQYQAKYFAHKLTQRFSSDSVERLAVAVAGAQVDLNPHQVEAALFAFKSPLSKGALLADEVGLGKTIEAGMVLSQKWAERKRKILIITPSSLRKQWHLELADKFFLPSKILESKSYKAEIKAGNPHPFRCPDQILICSYHFARNKASEVVAIPWDLVVIDEAHRLRNVYKSSNVIAKELKAALRNRPKLLLTATPLQNSLLELYGLVSFIDEHIFGDLRSFKEQFSGATSNKVFDYLRKRLQAVCHRTLRSEVAAYISYTQRLPLVEEFLPEDNEDKLYNLVSEYLQRPNLQALPSSQRSLMTLVLRKLLASSSFAIAGALETMTNRLKDKLANHERVVSLEEELDQDFETLDELAEEWDEDLVGAKMSPEDRAAIESEILDLESFSQLATSIEHNAKGKALLKALHVAMDKAQQLGAAEKAIIFTESRRTQDYLVRVLADSPWKDSIVLFNGSNNDERSKVIYSDWLKRAKGTGKVTGSRTADMRSAIVDYFRDEGSIMIATEAGAEGINLQFCSLVVNYDLPWNPQRIEQRIGRCHRYGQKHDVVVVNFLNKKNEADQRVFQLLSEKFKLFEGVFGASDEVLGSIESGIDFEKRIAEIYHQCRKPDEIKAAFDQLQEELSQEINEAMTRTREKILKHFDDEVREKLRIKEGEETRVYLKKFERRLMQVTRHELEDYATFRNPIMGVSSSFVLNNPPSGLEVNTGLYELPRRSEKAHIYRVGHPLAQWVIQEAQRRDLPLAELEFDYDRHKGKVSVLEKYIGRRGWLSVSICSTHALKQDEDYFVIAAITDDGEELEQGTTERLLTLPAHVLHSSFDETLPAQLETAEKTSINKITAGVQKRNLAFFEAEIEKLDNWADDLKLGLEQEVKDLDRQIREAKKVARAAASLEEKLQGQRRVKSLETQRNAKRQSLFEAQDDVDNRREVLIEDIEANLELSVQTTPLFQIRWVLTNGDTQHGSTYQRTTAGT